MEARLDPYSKYIIQNVLIDFLHGSSTNIITTPNPEILVASKKNNELKNALRNSDLGIIDGVGLHAILKLKGLSGSERITGVDLVYELASLCEKYDKSIMLIGAGEGIAAEAKHALQKKHQSLKISSYIGPNISYKLEKTHPFAKDDEEVINEIIEQSPDVLVVAFGAKKQEIWINNNKEKFNNIKIIVGVGGALDMISGSIQRAPKFMRKFGFEWLWRFFMEPSRIVRIARALFIFPIHAAREKIHYN